MNQAKKKIITITGRPGSGKSTTAKIITSKLGYTHFSAGDLFRSVAKEQGQDITTTNQEAEKENGIPRIDQLLDQTLRNLGATGDRLVIDSRLAWHWIPDSFRVYLDLDLQTAAKRILKDITPERKQAENISNDPEVYTQELKERLASETRRYKKLYNADPYDHSNYDLVVDTKANDIDTVVNLILNQYQEWLKLPTEP